MIRQHEGDFPVRLMCLALRVSPSGYCAWRERPLSTRAQQRTTLNAQVCAAFEAERGRTGVPCLTKRLRAYEWRGIGKWRRACAGKVCAAKRRTSSWPPRIRRTACRSRRTGCSRTSAPTAPTRSGSATYPYIPADEDWLYLAVVLDLYSRQGAGLGDVGTHDRHLDVRRAVHGVVPAPFPEMAPSCTPTASASIARTTTSGCPGATVWSAA